MKRILCFILCIFSMLFIASCGEDVDEIPVISINDSGVASWQAIKGAKGYEYTINDGDVVSVAEDVTSIKLLSGEAIKVRAVFKKQVGEWSEIVFCSISKALPKPSVTIKAIGNQVLVSWEIDKNAVSYEYSLNGGTETPISATSFLINATDTFRIRAKGDGEFYLDSDWKIIGP